MKHFLNTSCMLLIIMVLFSNCNHYYYAPNTIPTPLLQQKHDAEINLGICRGQNLQGFELQGVYSPVKYGAVMVNHFQGKGRDTNAGGFNSGKGRLTEFGLGTYHPTRNGSMALFAGWGEGFVENQYSDRGNSMLHFNRVFIQPTISTKGQFFRLGAGLRLVHLQYGKGVITHVSDFRALTNLQQIEQKSPFFFPEICVNGGIWIGPVTVGIAATLVNSNRGEMQNFAKSNVSLQTTIALQRLRK